MFEHGRVWTLVTSPFLEPTSSALLLHGLDAVDVRADARAVLGHGAVLSVRRDHVGRRHASPAASSGWRLGRDVPILGLTPFIYASIVAFGIIYARQPVQFFGVLPLTGPADDVRLHRVRRAVRRAPAALGAGAAFAGGDDRGGDHDVEAVEPGPRAGSAGASRGRAAKLSVHRGRAKPKPPTEAEVPTSAFTQLASEADIAPAVVIPSSPNGRG